MKKLLTGLAAALLSFVPLTSEAEIIATADNKSGGGIYLMSEKCSKGGMIMMARNPDGSTHFGCYVVKGDFILAKYDDGTVYTYDVTSFTLTAAGEAGPQKQPSSARSAGTL